MNYQEWFELNSKKIASEFKRFVSDLRYNHGLFLSERDLRTLQLFISRGSMTVEQWRDSGMGIPGAARELEDEYRMETYSKGVGNKNSLQSKITPNQPKSVTLNGRDFSNQQFTTILIELHNVMGASFLAPEIRERANLLREKFNSAKLRGTWDSSFKGVQLEDLKAIQEILEIYERAKNSLPR